MVSAPNEPEALSAVVARTRSGTAVMLCCAGLSPRTIATEVGTSCSRSLRLLAVTTISFAEASASRISLPPASLCAHAVLDACRASTAANALVKLLILFPPKSTIFNDDHFLRNDHLVQNDHTFFQEKRSDERRVGKDGVSKCKSR